MSVYQCCDCGEIRASKSDLEAHLNSDHIGWSPYQCLYCCQQGVSTRKPNKEMLREHVTQRHPNHPFTFICTDDQANKERLRDMLRRSTSHIQSTDVTDDTCLSATGTSPDSIRSPFVITLLPSPQPKVEIVDVEESTTHSTISTSDSLVKIEKQTDIKPNLRVGLGNCRCETCHETVPRNLIIIRDHVKVHFKEKTGCVPADLTHLLPNLQQIYCQSLMTSFPSVGASILSDDIPNYNQTNNQEETEDNGTMIQQKDNGQVIPENDIVLADNDSMSRKLQLRDIPRLKCKLKAATKKRSAPKQNRHLSKDSRDVDKFDLPQKDGISRRDSRNAAKLVEDKTEGPNPFSCEICDGKFSSMRAVKAHRASKHGILVKWHCKECNINLTSNILDHLLIVHLGKKISVCNLCNSYTDYRKLAGHDRHCHGGLRKAQVINNIDRYRKEIGELRNTLIIDINMVGKLENSLQNNSISPPEGKSIQQSIPKLQLKSKNPAASESVQWMSDFKWSQKRKRRQKEVLLQAIWQYPCYYAEVEFNRADYVKKVQFSMY